MYQIIALAVRLALIVAGSIRAVEEPITNEDVVTMVTSGFTEPTIIAD